LNAMQTIDSDPGPAYVPDNSIYSSMDSILQPDF